jgi:hypothetical protein
MPTPIEPPPTPTNFSDKDVNDDADDGKDNKAPPTTTPLPLLLLSREGT